MAGLAGLKRQGGRSLKFLRWANGKIRSAIFRFTVYIIYIVLRVVSTVYSFRLVFTDENRIGGLLANTESYLRARTITESNEIPIFIYPNPCSRQFIGMLARKYTVIEHRLCWRLLGAQRIKAKFGVDPTPLNMNTLHVSDNMAVSESHLSDEASFAMVDEIQPEVEFDCNDHMQGAKVLEDMSMGEDDWYMCFHARDELYLALKGGGNHNTYDYHNYRDCSVESYLDAANFIVSQGGHAVRMGYLVKEDLPSHEGIIDYAKDYRSDFGDIYLPAHAKFFLGNTSGLICASYIYNVPVAVANWIPLAHCLRSARDLFIPKKIWSIEHRRLLRFGEILDNGIGSYWLTEQYVDAGLEVVDNTAEEVKDLAVEMFERVSNTWDENGEDRELQDRFRSLFDTCDRVTSYTGRSRIGAKFLRDNRSLL